MARSRSPAERLADIASSISKVEKFLAGMTFAEFTADPLTHDAVVRNLEIISEASRHLGDLTEKAPEVPWRKVADMGNWLRHGYDIVNDHILWDTIKDDLPALARAIQRLSRPGGE